VRDYENLIARLNALPAYVDQSIKLMREQLAAGLTQPTIVVNLMIDQVAAQGRTPASESPLLAGLRNFPAEVSAGDQTRLRAAAQSAYEQQFVPSWKKLESFLRDTYLRARARS
jgi:uncharacterized protein (DUF885 family)